MAYGKKFVYEDITYLRKNHFCPTCEGKVDVVSVSRVIDPKSEEAKDFDFTLGNGTNMVGPVEFHWKEFECRECQKHYTVRQMKKIEGIEEKTLSQMSPKETIIHNLKVIAFLILAALIFAIIQHFLNK